MDQSLDTLQQMEIAANVTLVPRELCTATIAAIDGALRKLGPLCEPVPEPIEPIDKKDADPYCGVEGSPPKVYEGDVESGAGAGEVEDGSKSPLRNATLTYDQYMAALLDDKQAAQDEEMFKEPVTTENVGSQLDNAMRILNRFAMGLRPAPKASVAMIPELKRKHGGLLEQKKQDVPKPIEPKKKPLPSSSSGLNLKKGNERKNKTMTSLDETTKKQLHSATHLKLIVCQCLMFTDFTWSILVS